MQENKKQSEVRWTERYIQTRKDINVCVRVYTHTPPHTYMHTHTSILSGLYISVNIHFVNIHVNKKAAILKASRYLGNIFLVFAVVLNNKVDYEVLSVHIEKAKEL